ncbi:MAG: helix-turn-helix domain-containing protein, partial [Nitrososphaerota archaeon]
MLEISEKLRRALHRLGLTDYEIKVYKTLLENGELTASKLSELADVPYSKIYEVLE